MNDPVGVKRTVLRTGVVPQGGKLSPGGAAGEEEVRGGDEVLVLLVRLRRGLPRWVCCGLGGRLGLVRVIRIRLLRGGFADEPVEEGLEAGDGAGVLLGVELD